MAEKRDIIRLRKRLTLRFGVEEPARMAFTEDISPEGMFIKTTNICPPGSRIKINLTAQSGEVLAMEALVMWAKKVPPQMIHLVKKCGMGVRITRFINGEEAYQQLCGELMTR
ncbi:MAG: pilus assembly protein PilZ [Geobacter sp.]|nr:MAG: pilus assembly protein PilZ [Geobacter sp.]